MVLYNVLTLTFIVLIYYSSCLFKRKLSELEGFKLFIDYYSGFPKETPELKFRHRFFFCPVANCS